MAGCSAVVVPAGVVGASIGQRGEHGGALCGSWFLQMWWHKRARGSSKGRGDAKRAANAVVSAGAVAQAPAKDGD